MTNTKNPQKENISVQNSIENSLEMAEQQKHLGAFIHLDVGGSICKARNADKQINNGQLHGPLQGVPIVIKDNIHVANMPNSAGTESLKEFVPPVSNSAVLALEAAGAIVIGKTNMHELAFGITSNNAAFGPVRNAHNAEFIAGGSSGGTAVAVAANVVTMGLGTDTGGSVRIPAALNGVVGLRPTLGRYDTSDVTPVASTRDTIGPIANSVTSLALMDSVITGTSLVIKAASSDQLKLGVPREYFYRGLAKEVNDNITRVLKLLEDADITLIDVALPNLQALNDSISFPVALHEFMTELPVYLKKYYTGVDMASLVSQVKSPDVIGAIESQQSAAAIPTQVYKMAVEVQRPKLKTLYADAFNSSKVDAFIVPATPCAAKPIANSDNTVELNGAQVPTFATYIRNTDPSSNAGLPSLALPSGITSSGLPIGILLDGPEHSDRRLLEIALLIEQLLDPLTN